MGKDGIFFVPFVPFVPFAMHRRIYSVESEKKNGLWMMAAKRYFRSQKNVWQKYDKTTNTNV